MVSKLWYQNYYLKKKTLSECYCFSIVLFILRIIITKDLDSGCCFQRLHGIIFLCVIMLLLWYKIRFICFSLFSAWGLEFSLSDLLFFDSVKSICQLWIRIPTLTFFPLRFLSSSLVSRHLKSAYLQMSYLGTLALLMQIGNRRALPQMWITKHHIHEMQETSLGNSVTAPPVTHTHRLTQDPTAKERRQESLQ